MSQRSDEHTPAEFGSQMERQGKDVAAFIQRYIAAWTPYRSSWNYEDGCVYLGCLELADATGQRFLRDFVYREVSNRIAADGAIAQYDPGEFNLDNLNAGKVLFRLLAGTGESRFRLAIEQQRAQLARHPRTRGGNYWHKKIYPWQVWLDGLYMAQPFQVACGRLAQDVALLEDTVRQFDNVRTTMRDTRSGLYYHGWDESRQERWSNPQTGCSENFWGRAMGWFMMALVDCLGLLTDARPSMGIRPDTLREMFVGAAGALQRVRSPGALWWQVLDQPGREGNYEECSASLMIAYAMMKGARLGFLPADSGALGARSLGACIERFLSPAALGGICAVAGLGNVPYRDGSYAYYVSEPIVENDPKGVGALFMALAEGHRRVTA